MMIVQWVWGSCLSLSRRGFERMKSHLSNESDNRTQSSTDIFVTMTCRITEWYRPHHQYVSLITSRVPWSGRFKSDELKRSCGTQRSIPCNFPVNMQRWSRIGAEAIQASSIGPIPTQIWHIHVCMFCGGCSWTSLCLILKSEHKTEINLTSSIRPPLLNERWSLTRCKLNRIFIFRGSKMRLVCFDKTFCCC